MELKQKRFLRGSRELRIDGDKLHFDSVSPDQSIATMIPLGYLDPNPQRLRNTSISGIVFLSFLFGMGLLVLLFSIVTAWDTDEFWGWAIVYGTLWIAAVMGTFGYLTRTYDYIVYPNMAGGVSVTLFPGLPSEAEMQKFCKGFETRISASQKPAKAHTDHIIEAIDILQNAGLVDWEQAEEMRERVKITDRNTIN